MQPARATMPDMSQDRATYQDVLDAGMPEPVKRFRAEIAQARRVMDPQPYETPYAPMQPLSAYALATRRHMHQYGTTRAQLAEVAVSARRWAQLNPDAFSRDALTIEDVVNARMISDPLTVRDCCLVTDGGGAFIVVGADRARDFPKPPVYLLGSGAAHWHRQIASMPDLTVTAATESGKRAYAMAGLHPSDIDVLQLYDAFTINTLLFLEDLGFCAKGESGPFVEGGRIGPGGELPVNTNGGGLSCVHPGMYGVFLVVEAVRQLRGECGARQVMGAQTALVAPIAKQNISHTQHQHALVGRNFAQYLGVAEFML